MVVRNELIITQGLPASGKTTWAEKWQAENLGKNRIVCRDDIRLELTKLQGLTEIPRNGAFESEVKKQRDFRIKGYLEMGYSVCCADTNLNEGTVNGVSKLATKDVAVRIQSFKNIPLITCLQRDAKRYGNARVGETVIIAMWERYLREAHDITHDFYSPWKANVVVCDLDGTVADNSNRSPYNYANVSEDTPIVRNIKIIQSAMIAGYGIVFASGRPDSCRQASTDWIKTHIGIANPDLYMRFTGDTQPDWSAKEEMAREILEKYNILYWLDDRWQVSAHLRSLGINVHQVNFGRF